MAEVDPLQTLNGIFGERETLDREELLQGARDAGLSAPVLKVLGELPPGLVTRGTVTEMMELLPGEHDFSHVGDPMDLPPQGDQIHEAP